MSDLRKLIEAVEAGRTPPGGFREILATVKILDAQPLRRLAYAAYTGSLDAALAMLGALLPGWRWWRKPDGTMAVAIAHPYAWFEQDASEIGPARALLLVILRAKAAEGGE